MRMNRQRRATMGLVVLAVLLGSLWTGREAASAASLPAGQLAAGAALPALEPGALPDRVPALRPSAQPDPGGRLLPLLLGLLAASLTVAHGVPARGRRSSGSPARSLARSAPWGPRAPPLLQPV